MTMSMPPLSFFLLAALTVPFLSAEVPSDWQPKVDSFDALFAESDDGEINSDGYPGMYTPLVGNGYFSHSKGVRSDSYYIAGVFNGETTSPSHRARIPATFAVTINDSVTTGALLDMREATFYRRGNLTASGDWYELRWYAHMQNKHLYVMEFKVNFSPTSNAEYVTVLFTNNGGDESEDIDFHQQDFEEDKYSFALSCGETKTPETKLSDTITVCVASPHLTKPFNVTRSDNGRIFSYITTVYTSLDASGNDANDVADFTKKSYIRAAKEQESDSGNSSWLHETHVLTWDITRLASGIETIDRSRPDVATAINASLYAMLCSAPEAWSHDGLAPGGLTNYYNGHTFWDAETWMYPPMRLLHPALADNLITYRFERLKGAYTKAKTYSPPYSGAMFPWESAYTGVETCPEWAATGLREQHISADISLAVWQQYCVSGDKNVLRKTGMPVLTGVADFYLSRAVYDESGIAHIHGVIPPDEYVDNVTDSVYTNFAAATALRLAVKGAKILDMELLDSSKYLELADALVVLYDDDLKVHPEYLGYGGEVIKQADAVMLHYPWELPMDSSVQLYDLEYYSERTDENGPAMTWGIHSIGYKDLLMMEKAAYYFNKSFADNMQPPFMVWTETPKGNAANFITGAGGFLQTVMFGYAGLRIEDDRLEMSSPLCIEGTSGLKLRRVNYLSEEFDVTYECSASKCGQSYLPYEVRVTLQLDNGVPLQLVRYGVNGSAEEFLNIDTLHSEVKMTLPCNYDTSGSSLAFVRRKYF